MLQDRAVLGLTAPSRNGSPAPEDGGAAHCRPILRTRGVVVRFGGVVALTGVTLDIHHEVCGLIGPNGAGKTTLFDTIAGVRVPTEGRIELGGVDITTRSSTWRARRGIRRTFQRQQIFGWLSVEDNVLAAMDWHGGGGGLVADLFHSPSRRARERERRERCAEVMDLCGIADVAHSPAGQLPIGRARMVEVARAIVDRPSLLLFDEPTSGLEAGEIEKLGRVMRRLRNEERCSIVLVEHDVGFVMERCDRVVVLNLGTVIADGPPDAVRNDPAVVTAYLG